jgi:tetratricopeptide (TPR) repeat protein
LEKLEETAAALVDCSRAIEADPQFSKAWYRRGKAKAAGGDLLGAVNDFEKALGIENREDFSASPPDRESAPAGVGRGGEAAALSSSGEREALEGLRRESLDRAQEAGKGKVVSGSAKQIASELERVRALLLEVEPAGGALKRNSHGGNPAQVEKRGVKDGQKGVSTEMEIAQVGGSALCGGVEVFHQQGKGRGLRTTKFFRPGDTVISEEPYAAVLLKAQRASHCHHCFGGLPWNPLPCRGCAGPLFCRETCRDAALERSPRALELSTNGSGIETKPVNGGPSQRAGSYHADTPARTSSDERVCTQRREESDGLEGASARKAIESEGGGEGPAGGAFRWHAHECGGAGWAAVLPPDMVLAVRMLARLQKEQSKAVKEPSAEFCVDSKVSEENGIL